MFALAVFSLDLCHTEDLQTFPCGERGEVGRLIEGAVTGVLCFQCASAMGAGKVFVFLVSVCDSPLVSALHTGMAE